MVTHASQTRSDEIFSERLFRIQKQTDRVFAVLLAVQWAFAILLSLTVSPRTWVLDQPFWHIHLWGALGVGAALSVFPIFCALTRPGRTSTRYIVAIAQVGYSSLLIHLTGGRIETHFHIFGSLAFLSFYRDWKVFVPATLVVATDHLLRGFFWPQSVFGVIAAAPWRAFEHAGWVIFEDLFLVWGCLTSRRELHEMADSQAELEAAKEDVERTVSRRTRELEAKTADLVAEQRLLDATLHGVGDGIVAVDHAGRIICINKGAEEILGIREADGLAPEDWPERFGLCTPDKKTLVALEQIPLYRAMGGETVSHEEFVVSKRGAERVVSVNASPLELDSQQGGIATFHDMTEQLQLKGQLAEAQKLESIGQLAAGVAHEINTPMQYVSDNVEFLSECSEKLFEVVDIYRENLLKTEPPRAWEERAEQVDEAQERCRFEYIRKQVPLAIQETREGARRVIEIVRAMKQLSHPGGDTKVSTDINEAIRSTATITKNRWKYAADLEMELDENLPDVKTLTAEINQVLLNLVVNAADAIVDKNGENGAKGLIKLRTRGAGDRVVIEVEDNGCGMPEEVKRRIFEPFYTTKEVGKGTGQGLSISFNVIVNHHGGTLDVQSKPGEGTTFVVELPCVPPELVQQREESSTEQPVAIA